MSPTTAHVMFGTDEWKGKEKTLPVGADIPMKLQFLVNHEYRVQSIYPNEMPITIAKRIRSARNGSRKLSFLIRRISVDGGMIATFPSSPHKGVEWQSIGGRRP